MNQSLLIQSANIFEGSNIIDRIRQTCIEIENSLDEGDIQDFLEEVNTYLIKDLQIDVLNELSAAIIICFKHYSKRLLPFLEGYLLNAKLNKNYILLIPTIIAYLIVVQPELILPDYHSFVSSCLNEILPQILDDTKLTIFGHEIPLQFKNDLIINLLFSTRITDELILNFFPYLFSFNFSIQCQKFDLLLMIITFSDLKKILPQTNQSNQELFEFITNKDFKFISKMSKEAFSIVECSIMFSKSEGKNEIENLTKETVLQFISIISIFTSQFQTDKNIYLQPKLFDLVIEGINFYENDHNSVITASIDEILSSYYNLFNLKIFSPDQIIQILQLLVIQLLNNKYFAKKSILLNTIFKISDQFDDEDDFYVQISELFKYHGADFLNYCIVNLSELEKMEDLKNKLSFLTFKDLDISQFIENSTNIFDTIYFIENYCMPSYIECSQKLREKLFDCANQKVNEKKWKDIKLIESFMHKNELYKDIDILNAQLDFPDEFKINNHFNVLNEEKETIESIIDYLLKSNNFGLNGKVFQILFNKMLEHEELFQIYISFLVLKCKNISLPVDSFLKLYKNEYEKYQNKFIEVVNKIFYMNEKERVLLKNPNFSIYSLHIPEIGNSIVSKLFESIEKNQSKYQSFIVLKNIMCTFPLLFHNKYIDIINLVLPSLDNFSLIIRKDLNDEKVTLFKTSYSAFSFIISSFQLPYMFDYYIKWFCENVRNCNDSQIIALVNVIRYIINDNTFLYSMYIWSLKTNLLEIINDLFEREIKDEILNSCYKESFYDLLRSFYLNLNKRPNNVFIQIEELSKLEFPSEYLNSKLYLSYSALYLNEKFDLSDIVNYSVSLFMDEIDRNQDYWLSQQNELRKNKPSSEQVDEFIEKFGENKFNQNDFNIPQIPNSCTIKMAKYLLMKPMFIFLLFYYKTQIPLVPCYYEMIQQTSKDLQKIQEQNIENDDVESYNKNEILLKFFDHPKLFKNLFCVINDSHFIIDCHVFSLFCDLFKEICSNENALCCVFDLLSSHLCEIYQNDILLSSQNSVDSIVKIMHVLKGVINELKEKFFDIFGNKLIDILLTPRYRANPTLLTKSLEFLSSFTETSLPIRSIQLISFGILTNDKKNISISSKLLSKFDKNELITVIDLLLDFIDNESKELSISDAIFELIKNYPMFVTLRRPSFLAILDNLCERYNKIERKDQKILDMISFLFNSLAPERGNSISRTNIIDKASKIPESIREKSPIFWEMFEKHSLMIYQLIEKNPILLDKFNFLLNYPELLSFNVRSSYFRTKMKNKIDLKSLIQIKINRKNLLNSSFNVLNKISNEDFLRRICIVYNDEPGVDTGGIVRDWFTNLIKEIFNQNYGLFICSGINNSYTPNRLSYLNSNHLDYYKFVGRLIARALMQPQCVDAHFSASFCKQILHRVPNFDDLKEIDDVLFESLKYMQNNDVDSLEMFFAINREELGVVKTIPLIENGENISVTNKNKNEYIRLRVNYFFNYETKDQAKAFCEGFDSLISHDEIKIFTPNELDLLICGIPVINVDDFRNNTEYSSPYNNDHPVINMFFNVISKWDGEKLAKLLLFMAGSSRVPSNGFKELCEMCKKKLKIVPGGNREKLPQSHTCDFMLCLPEYQNEEELNDKLLYAIQNANSFEFQ